jgi:type II secretion system protein J
MNQPDLETNSPALRRGFTLMEMVISIALMTLILGAGYACLRSGILSQNLIHQRTDAFQNARVALNLIASDLRAACRLSSEFEFLGMSREIGADEADNLDFATRRYSPQASGEADFCETSYFLRKSPRSGLLTLFRRRDASPDRDPLAGGVEEPLAEGIKSLRLEYYDGYEWFDEWGDPQGKRKGQPDLRGRSNLSGLPEAVRITLAVRVGSPPPSQTQGMPPRESVTANEDPPFVVQTVARLPGGASRTGGSNPSAPTANPGAAQ